MNINHNIHFPTLINTSTIPNTITYTAADMIHIPNITCVPQNAHFNSINNFMNRNIIDRSNFDIMYYSNQYCGRRYTGVSGEYNDSSSSNHDFQSMPQREMNVNKNNGRNIMCVGDGPDNVLLGFHNNMDNNNKNKYDFNDYEKKSCFNKYRFGQEDSRGSRFRRLDQRREYNNSNYSCEQLPKKRKLTAENYNIGTIHNGAINGIFNGCTLSNCTFENLMKKASEQDAKNKDKQTARKSKNNGSENIKGALLHLISTMHPISCIFGFALPDIFYNTTLMDLAIPHIDLSIAFLDMNIIGIKKCFGSMFNKNFYYEKKIHCNMYPLLKRIDSKFCSTQTRRQELLRQTFIDDIADIIIEYDNIIPSCLKKRIEDWSLCDIVEFTYLIDLHDHIWILQLVNLGIDFQRLKKLDNLSSICILSSNNVKKDNLCKTLLHGLWKYENCEERSRNGLTLQTSRQHFYQILNIEYKYPSRSKNIDNKIGSCSPEFCDEEL